MTWIARVLRNLARRIGGQVARDDERERAKEPVPPPTDPGVSKGTLMATQAIRLVTHGALLFLATCGTPSILVPPEGPETAYPCGRHSHSCGGGMCCDNGNQCGATGTNCPALACCYVGQPDAVGVHPNTKQYPERR